MQDVVCVFAATSLSEDAISEFLDLLKATELKPVKIFKQNLHQQSHQTLIGKGKCEEIKDFLENETIETVIFHQDITALQARNLEEIFTCTIKDRSDIILDIFEKRAHSLEAKLQIANAKNKRAYSRLVGLHENFSRQSGSGKNKGSGETQLELDRRTLKMQVRQTREQLKKLQVNRVNQRRARQKSQLPLVSLLGYTNAGKSTILNAILAQSDRTLKKTVLAKDMLFATLDTSIREIKLHNNRGFLLSDTVGFIKDLPKELYDSFQSTLMETTHADLILHIVDISDPHHVDHIDTTNAILQTLKAADIPVLIVYNQCDKVQIKTPTVKQNNIYINALKSSDITFLIQKIQEATTQDFIEISILLPYDQSTLYHELKSHAVQIDCLETPLGYEITALCSSLYVKKLTPYIKKKDNDA